MDETEVNFIFCHFSIKSHVFQDESARNQPKTPVLIITVIRNRVPRAVTFGCLCLVFCESFIFHVDMSFALRAAVK
jgi:hypothetical protein